MKELKELIEADRKTEQTEPKQGTDCTQVDWKDEMWTEAVKDEPQTDWHYDEQDATWYPYKHEDEPQTDCPWKWGCE